MGMWGGKQNRGKDGGGVKLKEAVKVTLVDAIGLYKGCK